MSQSAGQHVKKATEQLVKAAQESSDSAKNVNPFGINVRFNCYSNS